MAHSKLVPNWGRPLSGFNRRTRPSTAGTAAAAAAAAAEAAEAREKLRSAPATLFPDSNYREFQTPARWRHCASPTGKIHHGSTLKRLPDSALNMPITLEEEQRLARRPIKSVTFNFKQTSSPYTCKMSNRAAKKTKSYRDLNYTGVTGGSGVPLDVQFMELKAKNSVKNVSKSEPPSKIPLSSASGLQDALNIATTLDILEDELDAQQGWCARLTRSLKQQKEMLRLIKRTKSRRAFTCENIMSDVSDSQSCYVRGVAFNRHGRVDPNTSLLLSPWTKFQML